VEALSDVTPERLRELAAAGEPFWVHLEGADADRRVHMLEALAHAEGAEEEVRATGTGIDGDRLVDVHIYATPTWLATATESRLPPLDDAVAKAGGARSTADAVALVLAALAGSFQGYLTGREERRTGLEEAAAGGDPNLRRELLDERAPLVRLARTARRQARAIQDAIAELERLPGTTRRERAALQDALRASRRAADELEDAVARMNSALDLHDSAVASRMNEIMERLTVVATIFLPLTVVTGFFGMNFGTLVRAINDPLAFWTLGLGSVIVSGGAIALWIRRSVAAGSEP
jgi:magnesium transporter